MRITTQSKIVLFFGIGIFLLVDTVLSLQKNEYQDAGAFFLVGIVAIAVAIRSVREVPNTPPRSIRCALCGGVIYQSETVALYDLADERIRNDAELFGDQAIGCGREGCCMNVALLKGMWTGRAYKTLSNSQIRSIAVETQNQEVKAS